MKNNSLEDLLKATSHVSKGPAAAFGRVHSSGVPAWDARLPGGGWPAGLLWVYRPVAGLGEMRLFLPLCAQRSAAGRHVVLLDPPWTPYPPAWAAAGVRLERLHWLQPPDEAGVRWALDALVRCPACGVLGCWPRRGPPPAALLQRLQQAGAAQGAVVLWFTDRKRPPPGFKPSLHLALWRDAAGRLWLAGRSRRGTVLPACPWPEAEAGP
ncbi:MAG: hypothetical protein KatS3mg121_1279 [Gammaproteobacteria bacterium]|nr:MAG: hypothetical protein KatS3mg121_1279 [Gammaproteobacteria bacterium]